MASASEAPIPARRIMGGTRAEKAYTIATLVTDPGQYDAMRASFIAGGFGVNDCEYIFIDNTGSEQTCAYRGLSDALSQARGRYVILCHQDVRVIENGDSRTDLDMRLAELNELDSSWAIAGNAGGVAPGQLALRITDPHGQDQHIGDLPALVSSLDENFIVVRKDANLTFSHDLSGFHFYASDLCLIADILGWNAYVINFHIEHLSPGNSRSRDFAESKELVRTKWSKALRPRWLQTTCTLLRLDGEPLRQIIGHLLEEPVRKLSQRMPGARGWTGTPLPGDRAPESDLSTERNTADQPNSQRGEGGEAA